MKQAFHIFCKDARRLRWEIAALMAAIAYFAVLDVRVQPMANGTPLIGVTTEAIGVIAAAAVWFLIARAVHQEPLPGEDQFWLTRPYERSSLLLSKIMMAVFVVSVPMLVADCFILGFQSLPVAENLAGLVLRQIVISAWLIVPPFAIAAITRSITEDVLIWLVVLAIAVLGYFPGTTLPDFRAFNEKYALLATFALLLAAIGRQYLKRATKTSRAMIVIAALLPVLPFPESAALAIDGMRNDPATAGISLAPKSDSATASEAFALSPVRCAPVAVSVTGMRPEWRLEVLSQKDTFAAGGKSWSMRWRTGSGQDPAAADLSVCLLNPDSLKGSGTDRASVETSLALAVFAEDPPIRVPATLRPFQAPGIGTCQFQYGFRTDKYVLGCKAPVWFPRQGRVVIGSVDDWSSAINTVQYPWTPMNLLPGMSPVYKWATLPLDNQIRDAIANGGQLEIRPETRIAVLRRELTVKEVLFPGVK